MILKKISCHILCYNLILQSTISSFFAFLFLVERSNMRQFDTVYKKFQLTYFLIPVVVTFYRYCSQALSVFILNVLKKNICMDPEILPGASGVFQRTT